MKQYEIIVQCKNCGKNELHKLIGVVTLKIIQDHIGVKVVGVMTPLDALKNFRMICYGKTYSNVSGC